MCKLGDSVSYMQLHVCMESTITPIYTEEFCYVRYSKTLL